MSSRLGVAFDTFRSSSPSALQMSTKEARLHFTQGSSYQRGPDTGRDVVRLVVAIVVDRIWLRFSQVSRFRNPLATDRNRASGRSFVPKSPLFAFDWVSSPATVGVARQVHQQRIVAFSASFTKTSLVHNQESCHSGQRFRRSSRGSPPVRTQDAHVKPCATSIRHLLQHCTDARSVRCKVCVSLQWCRASILVRCEERSVIVSLSSASTVVQHCPDSCCSVPIESRSLVVCAVVSDVHTVVRRHLRHHLGTQLRVTSFRCRSRVLALGVPTLCTSSMRNSNTMPHPPFQ